MRWRSSRVAGLPPFPVVETDNLVLRRMDQGDLDDLLRMRSDPRMHLHTDTKPDGTPDETKAYINKMTQASEVGRVDEEGADIRDSCTDGTVAHGLLWECGNQKLSEVVDPGIGIDRIRTSGIESPAKDDVFAYPVAVAKVDGTYCLISMMDGSVFVPSASLPEATVSLSSDVPDQPRQATIPATKTGVAVFKILQKESTTKCSIELLSYTLLSSTRR